MTKQSPHKRWKGCCMMCAAFIRGDGWAAKNEGRKNLLNKFSGKKRRVKRNHVPPEEEW